MFDKKKDPDYDFAENKPERLLLASLDYSLQKYVVYVADKPPRSVFRNIAALFFFQAEDGIRGATVTGVQTCALPIFRTRCRAAAAIRMFRIRRCRRRRS